MVNRLNEKLGNEIEAVVVKNHQDGKDMILFKARNDNIRPEEVQDGNQKIKDVIAEEFTELQQTVETCPVQKKEISEGKQKMK